MFRKTFNPIRDLFVHSNEIFKITNLDWTAFGVNNLYFILFTPRSGSTLLSRLIAETEMSNLPSEFFSESYLRRQIGCLSTSFREYFESLLKKNNKNGVFGCEIDAMRYHWLLELVDWDNTLRSDSGISVIWLIRQDIVSQAYSLAMAKLTQQWHVFADEKQKRFPREDTGCNKTPSGLDDKAIWAQIFYILKWEQSLEKKFRQKNFTPLKITYEQLICDQAITLVRIFAHLGFDAADIHTGVAKACTTNSPTIKMHYPDKIHQLTSFHIRYEKAIDAIQTNRIDITEEIIRKLISESNSGIYDDK